MKLQATIGLEIHAELNTRTKMFCNSKNEPDIANPNVNVCPICMGHPGTLPVINKEAVIKVLEFGIAIKGNLAKHAQFDRKSYFYPDLPKGYQISQYKHPLVENGELSHVAIERVHLEEDTAKIIHFDNYSAIDYNRAGVPLMELVTKPVIKSGREARVFAEELHTLLRYLDISNADMEKGNMRIEANISLSGTGLGTKVEVKNLNSFKAVERAINYEITRQSRELGAGRAVIQETRGWDENKGVTFSQRGKEEAHDYRYLPEPDLLPLELQHVIEGLKKVELPNDRAMRLLNQYDLPEDKMSILVRNRALMDYFEIAAKGLRDEESAKLALNYLTSDILAMMSEHHITSGEIPIQTKDFSSLISMIARKNITSRVAKDTLRIMFDSGEAPESIITREKLSGDIIDISDIAKRVIKENPDAAQSYKSGKKESIEYLIGQGMSITRGIADPKELKNAIISNLY